MAKYFKYGFIASIVILVLLFMVPQQVLAGISIYDPCPSGTGPGGITAGDYDPTKLTQDQRQWLFTIFGNAGIASDGYGGQRCGVPQPTNTPYVPPTAVPATTIPPTAVPPTNIPANSPTNTPESVAVSTLIPCPTGTGPGGITAGDYDPTKLTQDQRQWLFTIFGNNGQASVGYGGQRCGSGVSLPPPCPSGTGPDGITAGSYDPTKLTQDQRQWLFSTFGNAGTASVGYGGQACSGGVPFTPGTSGGSSGGSTGGSNGGSSSGSTSTITCPGGTGPGGITPGNYDPTKLTQDQRQWLFSIFGNLGTASVGYGGETCSGGVPFTPGQSEDSTGASAPAACPPGTGPGGITPGSYDPAKLSQDQRNWLYTAFGHAGTASDGYGGETCSGGTPYTPGAPSGGGSNPGGNNSSGTSGGTSGNSSSETWTQTTSECNINPWVYEYYSKPENLIDLVVPSGSLPPILEGIKTFFDYVGFTLKLIPSKHNIIADEVKLTFFVSNKGNYKVQIDRYLQGQLLTTDTNNVDKDTYDKLLENGKCSLLG